MLDIPKYTQYNGEKKIALIDNSAVEFMLGLKNKGHNPEKLLETYDLILLPGWVAEEVKDSAYRENYINSLNAEGYPIRLIEETSYSELMDGQELNLFEIVNAAVIRVGEFKSYLRRYVQKSDPLDMEEYSEWIEKMYAEWPIQTTITSSGRVKKKNAGEISLIILLKYLRGIIRIQKY